MSMRRLTIVLFAIAVLSTPAFAQPAATPTAEPTAVADIVEKSTRALNFREGDLDSLRNAESGFTAAGWAQFLKGLTGFIERQRSTPVQLGVRQVRRRPGGSAGERQIARQLARHAQAQPWQVQHDLSGDGRHRSGRAADQDRATDLDRRDRRSLAGYSTTISPIIPAQS